MMSRSVWLTFLRKRSLTLSFCNIQKEPARKLNMHYILKNVNRSHFVSAQMSILQLVFRMLENLP